MNKPEIKKIDGLWPSEIQIGPHLWQIKPIEHLHVWRSSEDMPMEDCVIVDHERHVVGLMGNFSPHTLAHVIAALVMGEKAGDL